MNPSGGTRRIRTRTRMSLASGKLRGSRQSHKQQDAIAWMEARLSLRVGRIRNSTWNRRQAFATLPPHFYLVQRAWTNLPSTNETDMRVVGRDSMRAIDRG